MNIIVQMLTMTRQYTKESVYGVAERLRKLASVSWMSKVTMMTTTNSHD